MFDRPTPVYWRVHTETGSCYQLEQPLFGPALLCKLEDPSAVEAMAPRAAVMSANFWDAPIIGKRLRIEAPARDDGTVPYVLTSRVVDVSWPS